MPKVKWGGDLDQAAIDEAENRGGETYSGEIPPTGTYRFKLRFSKRDKSKEGNPKLLSLLVLDGSWKKEHAKYDGCPLWDHMPVSKKTAFRVRAYCDALNVTSADFMNKMVVDDEGNVQKIGKLTIADEDRLVVVNVKRDSNDEYGERLILARGGGYLPFKDEDEDEDEDDKDETEDEDDDGDEPPF